MEQNTPISEIIPSLIRTYVPIIVASIVTILGQIGVILPEEASVGLATFIGAVASAAYYLGVRLLERKYPIVGKFLLGSSRVPVSAKPDNVVQLTAAKNAIEKDAA